MIALELFKRIPHQSLVHGRFAFHFISQPAGDFCNWRATIAALPNQRCCSVQTVSSVKFLVVDQQLVFESANY
jgi:hypothetical protein